MLAMVSHVGNASLHQLGDYTTRHQHAVQTFPSSFINKHLSHLYRKYACIYTVC